MTLINITIPVLNEQERLPRCIRRLEEFVAGHGQFRCEVVVANNGSTDQTQAAAKELSREFAGLRVVSIPEKGRGGAIKRAWMDSEADILTYMDVDLATDLAAFPPLLDALTEGGCDIAVGSRYLPASHTERGWKRELISRAYIRLVKWVFPVHFSDAQCGFKGIRREAAQALLPLVEDAGWFFDTELLVLAEHLGCRIGEVPVTWTDDPDSRVRILSTAWRDLTGLIRLRRKLRSAHFAEGRQRPALV